MRDPDTFWARRDREERLNRQAGCGLLALAALVVPSLLVWLGWWLRGLR